MLGNWATGNASIVIAPTMTITIEITMATIGRLMKNFDICSPSLGVCRKWFGIHLRPRVHFLHTLSDYAFALLQAFRNNPVCTHPVAHYDRSNVHFVLVVHYRDL